MPPRRKVQPAPLDRGLVATFHSAVLNGNRDGVNRQLSATPRLANAKNGRGFTPLMTVVESTTSPMETKVALIDILMHKGASLPTRGPNRTHILLLACRMGSPAAVIDCIMRWNSLRGKPLHWNQCDGDKDGPLVLAALSNSLPLLTHLLSLKESDTTENYADSNAGIKIVEAAIKNDNERMALLVLRHSRFKDEIDDVEIDNDSDDEDYFYGGYTPGTRRSITVDECVCEAYKRNMLEVVVELASLGNRNVDAQVWLCWRKRHADREVNGDADSEAYAPFNERINDIAMAYQGNLVHKKNPNLLPLLVARSHYTTNAATTESKKYDPLPMFLLQCEDETFRGIVGFAFNLKPETLQKEVEEDMYFQKHAEYCGDCEGYFLPYSCFCCQYTGYSS